MQSISELAAQLKPYIVNWNLPGAGGSGSGGGGMEKHALSGAFHTGGLSNNQAPQFLLLTGQRAMTGDLNMSSNDITNVGLINGVDINAIDTAASGQILAGAGISITGNGYIANTPTISVNTSTTAAGMAGLGLLYEFPGKLAIDNTGGGPSNGLEIVGNRLQIYSGIAGSGLLYQFGVMNINFGRGLTVWNDYPKLTVEYAELAGSGLGYDANYLFVNAGSNIKIESDAVAVDVPTLAGDGIGVSGTTLKVNTGDGIEIVSDLVKVRAADLIGPGINVVGNNFEVRPSTGLEIDATHVKVDLDYNFDWAGIHTHSANLSSLGAATGVSGYTLLPNGNADFRDIQADSLTVDAFIADVNLALAGSEYITKSGAILARDFTAPSTTGTLYVFDFPGFPDTQVFAPGDFVALRYIERGTGLDVGWIHGNVTNYIDLADGEQSWTFTRTSGTVGKIAYAGMWVIDYGLSGDGIIKSAVNDLESPYIDIQTWTTSPSSGANFTLRLRLGLLDGISDGDLSPSGYGLYSDNAYLHGELVLGNGEVVLDSEGLNLNSFYQTGFNTPEKINWWTDVGDRVNTKLTGYLGGFRLNDYPDIVTGGSQVDGNSLQLQAYSGYFSGQSTGAEFSRVRNYAQWAPDGGGGLSTALIESVATSNYSRINMLADDVYVSGAVGIYVSSPVIQPINNIFTDIGTPTKKFNKLYVDEIIAGTTSTIDTGHNHDDRYNLKSEITSFLAGKSNTTHTHAGYATVTYVDTELSLKSDTTHNHNATYYTEAEVDALIATTATSSHTHNTTYYTEAEMDALLAAKSDTSHTHAFSTVSAHSDLTGIGPDDHHNQAHAYDSSDHTGTLSWVNVNKTGALLSDIGGVLAWATVDLTGAVFSDFSDSLAWSQIDFTGSDLNDISGSLLWTSVSKTGSALTDIVTRPHGALTSIGANDHHSQQHALSSNDHTGTLANAQAPQFLLLDGSRSMSGNLLNDGGFDQDVGSYAAPWRNLHVLELIATRLVPQDIMATVDGRILVSTSGKLTRDAGSADTTIYIDTGAFENGEYAYLQSIVSGLPQFEAIQFASDATEITAGEEYSYTVVRNEDEPTVGAVSSEFIKAGLNSLAFPDAGFGTSLFASDNDAWSAGDGIVSLGTNPGDGFIDIASSNSIGGGQGPTISIYDRASTSAWNDINNVVAMGNLENLLDYNTPTFGFAVGSNLNAQIEAFTGLTATTSGIRLLNTPISYYHLKSGVQTLGGFFGKNNGNGSPEFAIGFNTQALFDEAWGGFIGGGVFFGWSPSDYFTCVIGDVSTTYLEFDGEYGSMSITGDVSINGINILPTHAYISKELRFSSNHDKYGLDIDYYFDNIGPFDTHTLRLKSDTKTTENGFLSGILLEAYTLGELKQQLRVNAFAVTLDGNMRIWRNGFSTDPGLFINNSGNLSDPAIQIDSNLEIWGHPKKTAIILNSSDTATPGGSGFSGSSGPYVSIGRNTNPSQPASGHIRLQNAGGTMYYIWVDAAGSLRFGSSLPNSNNDLSGVVIS